MKAKPQTYSCCVEAGVVNTNGTIAATANLNVAIEGGCRMGESILQALELQSRNL